MTNSTETASTVWVFCGGETFPSGVFATREDARTWIRHHRLTGCLTEYPIGIGIYEWAIERGAFTPTTDEQRSPRFIGRFDSAALRHEHFEDGLKGGE